jgi:NADH-quinone oxidoreductase subunit N
MFYPELLLSTQTLLILFHYSIKKTLYLKPLITLTLLFQMFLQLHQLCSPIITSNPFFTEYSSIEFKLLILIASIFILQSITKPEITIIILLTNLGTILILSSNNLIPLYFGLELLSLGSYLLAAANNKQKQSTEAGIKYYIIGGLSSGFLLLGISLIYGLTGITSFNHLLNLLPHSSYGIQIGFLFIIISLLFKLAAAPFHTWIPDIYEGAPITSTAYFAIIPKLPILITITTLLINLTLIPIFKQVLIYTAILSLIIGTLSALYQTRIKRLLAYSTITNIGFTLTSLITQQPIPTLTYLLIYTLSNIPLFIILTSIQFKNSNPTLYDLNTLINKPLLAMGFGIPQDF